jgi:hypothetical protein
LESEILNLEKLVDVGRTEIDNNRIKQKNFTDISKNMNQKTVKNKKKEMRLDNEKINHQINIQEQQIKRKKLEKKDANCELDKNQQIKNNEITTTTKEIEQKQQDLEVLNLHFTANNIVLDKLNENIDFINNISFSQNLVNTINNRNRNRNRKNKNNSLNSLNKEDKKDLVSNNNDLGKRKFSTLNFNKQNNNLDFLKLVPKARKTINKFRMFSCTTYIFWFK